MAESKIVVESPTVVLDNAVSCTGSGDRITVCPGVTLDCNGNTITNTDTVVDSRQKFIFLDGGSIKNCDVRNFESVSIIMGRPGIPSVVNSKVSGGNRGILIIEGKAATIQDVEVTGNSVGIMVARTATMAFDNVFSCANARDDVLLDGGSMVSLWDITCTTSTGIMGLLCPPGSCPAACFTPAPTPAPI
jgi:hypothetical protein